MKKLKYLFVITTLATSLYACSGNRADNNDRNSATLGGTQDTSNVSAGSNAGGVNAASSADTSNNGNKNRTSDSTSKGNANPSGHLENDTTNQSKYHRPK